MRADLLDILVCPDCRATMRLDSVDGTFHVGKRLHVRAGALRCLAGHRFPIIDEVPRLVPTVQLDADERRFLDETVPGLTRDAGEFEALQPAAVEARIEQDVVAAYGADDTTSPAERWRLAREVGYLVGEYRGDNKRKYAAFVKGRVPEIRSVLDVGGSLPGMLSAISREYAVDLAIVADANVRFGYAFKDPTRSIGLVRADATALPFRAGAFDLLVSAFLLEHVAQWKSALRSMSEAGRRLLIAFGPNRWFPFEMGHLDAPLAGTLPRPLAALTTYIWRLLCMDPRPLARIREILSGMTYISSRQFRRECGRLGVRAANVFPDFVALVAADRAAPPTLPRRIVRGAPRIAHAVGRALVWAGVEPNVYHFAETTVARPRGETSSAGEPGDVRMTGSR